MSVGRTTKAWVFIRALHMNPTVLGIRGHSFLIRFLYPKPQIKTSSYALPIGSLVVPFWDYHIESKISSPKKELLWSLYGYPLHMPTPKP